MNRNFFCVALKPGGYLIDFGKLIFLNTCLFDLELLLCYIFCIDRIFNTEGC